MQGVSSSHILGESPPSVLKRAVVPDYRKNLILSKNREKTPDGVILFIMVVDSELQHLDPSVSPQQVSEG